MVRERPPSLASLASPPHEGETFACNVEGAPTVRKFHSFDWQFQVTSSILRLPFLPPGRRREH
jgi:hypothetical protein